MPEIKLPENYSEIRVLAAEPLRDYRPEQIRELMKRYTSDDAIASLYAAVANKTGWLHHDLNEPENNAKDINLLKEKFHLWWELEKELYAEIVRRLEKENKSKGTDYVTVGMGTHYIVKPFMEQNGFIDGSGWWVDTSDG